jgi:chemotaxis protein MotB
MINKRKRHIIQDDSSGYMMSISDLMSGLVFIFIIALVYFVVHYKSVNKSLANRNATRTQILTEIDNIIKERDLDKNLAIIIDKENGVIHIRDKEAKKDKMLFMSGKADPEENGRLVIEGLSDLLREVLPCYTPNYDDCKLPELKRPTEYDRKLETVFIEGHTDRDKINNGQFSSNWELSVKRALGAYNILTTKNEYLKDKLCNEFGLPVFSVSGYGDTRPISKENDRDNYKLDRRIDLRFIMIPYNNDDIQKIVNQPVSSTSSLESNLSPK